MLSSALCQPYDKFNLHFTGLKHFHNLSSQILVRIECSFTTYFKSSLHHILYLRLVVASLVIIS